MIIETREFYMSNKKRKSIIVLIVVLAIMLGAGGVVRDHHLYKRSKPNIFEIPGTAYMHCIESVDFYQYQCHFMVQKLPDTRNDIQTMIENFLEQDISIQELFERDSRTTSLSLRFYVLSMKFPVYYEENSNYFKMDDFISHYEDNCILVVTYDNLEEATFLFKDATLDK